MLGISFSFPNEVDLSVFQQNPKPVLVLTFSEQKIELATAALFQKWIEKILEESSQQGIYTVLSFPITFLGAPVPTNEHIKKFLGPCASKVFAVHLTCGTLTWFDYYLRVHLLLRSGVSYSIIVDDNLERSDRNSYAYKVRDSAWGITGSTIVFVPGFRHYVWNCLFKKQVALQIVEQKTYKKRSLIWRHWKRLQK